MNGHAHALLKSISYRIFGTVGTGAITYLVTGEIKMAVTVGGLDFVTKIVLYYVHEVIWTRSPRK